MELAFGMFQKFVFMWGFFVIGWREGTYRKGVLFFPRMEAIFSWILKRAPARFVSWAFVRIFGKKNLPVFEKFLEIPRWKKIPCIPPEILCEKWIFEDNNSFVIEVSDYSRDFRERWTDRFPDKNSCATYVFLKIDGELICEPLLFIYVDGCRNFVPCPRRSELEVDGGYFWNRRSLEYRVFERIGFLDPLHEGIEKFAKRSGISIVDR